MDLLEYEGKELFEKYDIPVTPGAVIRTLAEAKEFASKIPPAKSKQEYVVKAQVLIGGRGKAGGIKFATNETIVDTCRQILGMDIKSFKVNEVMIVPKATIEKEYYLSLTLNRSDRNITFLFSTEGGMDIEEVAKKTPEKIIKVPLFTFDAQEQKQVKKALEKVEKKEEIFSFVQKLFRLLKEKDALLLEINPLALSSGKLLAVDAKVSLDDNALYRHEEYSKKENAQKSLIEQKAAAHDLQYVELDGDIAIIGNGAGLVMATLDVINHFGGKAANFLDVGGGASVEKMEQSLEVVLMKKNVKGIFINIFGGITRCDEIATGLVNYMKRNKLKMPLVVRMTGTNDKEGKKILQQNKIDSFDSMDECARKICSLVK